MRARPAITSLNAGEISPLLYGRSDLDWYDNAAKELENVACLPSGTADRRPGTRFVVAAKTEASAVEVLDFEFSSEQAYVIEAGDLYFRFCKDKGQLLDGPPVEVVTPYAAADLGGLKWAQSYDTLYLVHPDYAPRKLSRASETSWSLDVIAFTDGPYLDENVIDATTLQPSAVTGSVTITASAVDGINGGAGFAATDVGRLVRIKHGATWGNATITGWTSITVVTADVNTDFGATTAEAAWRLGLWSDTTGWPRCVTFHDERVCYAGAAGQPWRVDASASHLFETFTPGVNDGDAIAAVLSTGKANAIFWLLSASVLLAGTSAGVHRIGPEGDAAWTPSNSPPKKIESAAAADAEPAHAVTEALFIGRHGKRIRALAYSLEKDGLVARDATWRADHICGSGAIAMVWQQTPWQILWVLRADGRLAGLTFMPDQKVEGWHRHVIGGDFGGGNAVVESIAVIPGAAGDELWMVVKRTIDGATRRYIEVMEDWRDADTAQEDHFFVDSGLDYSGAATDTITGLDHLEGQALMIWADGGAVPGRTVTGGAITLASEASRVIAGLAATPRIVPMPPEPATRAGASVGRLKRISGLALRLWRTAGVRFGYDDAHLDDAQLNEGQLLGSPPDLFSGVTDQTPASDWGREADMVITSSQAGPLTVTALVPEMESGD